MSCGSQWLGRKRYTGFNVGREKKGEHFPNTGDDAGKIITAGMLTGRDVNTDSWLKQKEVSGKWESEAGEKTLILKAG